MLVIYGTGKYKLAWIPRKCLIYNKENSFKGETFKGLIVIYFIKHIRVVWICVLPVIPVFRAMLMGKWYPAIYER